MPIIWIEFPTGSTKPVHDRAAKPNALKAYVGKLVKAADPKAELIDLYFEVGAERAYAVVRNLDRYTDVKAVSSVLGATSATKLLNAAQATQSKTLEGKLPK